MEEIESIPAISPMIGFPKPHHHVREGLKLLLQAFDYACELHQDVWQFAIELESLRAASLNNSDLRWLIAKGFAEHAIEITTPDDHERRFRRSPLLTFVHGTCFALTRHGSEIAQEICFGRRRTLIPTAPIMVAPPVIVAPQQPTGRPKWDCQRRQLRVDDFVVKEFKLPSPNQELVLMAFEEERWPPRIDDPLTQVSNLEPRRRLHDTIKALNRKQKHCLIRFMGDGSGQGIRWEPIDRGVSQSATELL